MHEDDANWVTQQLKELPTPMLRQQILNEYKKEFKRAHDAEPLAHRKDGKARFSANNRLLIYIKKIKQINFT